MAAVAKRRSNSSELEHTAEELRQQLARQRDALAKARAELARGHRLLSEVRAAMRNGGSGSLVSQ